jgi:hypothetical protein
MLCTKFEILLVNVGLGLKIVLLLGLNLCDGGGEALVAFLMPPDRRKRTGFYAVKFILFTDCAASLTVTGWNATNLSICLRLKSSSNTPQVILAIGRKY